MADKEEVILKGAGTPFGGQIGKGVMEPLLGGLQNFGNNLAEVSDIIIDFFSATKTFLVKLRNPLAGPLIETIDSLIAVLEDLKDMGFGSCTVLPWQHGEFPAQVDTTKLDKAIIGLAAAFQGLDPKMISIGDNGEFVKSKNGTTLLTPEQGLVGDEQISQLNKEDIYDTLIAVRNFFHPETWVGDNDRTGSVTQETTIGEDAVELFHDMISWSQKNLIVRELPPKAVIDKVIKSVQSASSDSNRPTGSGDYKAYVLLFAAPTPNGILQILQKFVDYFASVLGDEFIRRMAGGNSTNDEKTTTIHLGDPLYKPIKRYSQIMDRERGKEWSYNQNDFIPLRNLHDGKYENSKLKEATIPVTGHYTDTGEQETRTIETTQRIGPPDERETIVNPEMGQNLIARPESRTEPDEKITTIPMFSPGDLITQEGGSMGFSNFTAKVVKHHPIIIKNGLVIQNKVEVKDVRGNYVPDNGRFYNTASSSKVRCVVRGDGGTLDVAFYPIFRSNPEEKPQFKAQLSCWATLKEDTTTLVEIIPNDTVGATLRQRMSKSGVLDNVKWDNTMMQVVKEPKFGPKVVASYLKLFRKLKPGMYVEHQFLNPFDLSAQNRNLYDDSAFADSDFKFNYGKLLDAMPSLGVSYCIEGLYLDGVKQTDIGKLKEQDILVYPGGGEGFADLPDLNAIPITMKKIEIKLGFLDHTQSVQTDFDATFGLEKKLINPPDGQIYSWQTEINDSPIPPFALHTTNKDISPNWKYIRVSDIFPLYGQVINEAIGQVKGFRAMVANVVKDIDDFVAFLERQIQAIKVLNQAIQELIVFLSTGLNGTGIYSGQFGGKGVSDFTNKLKNMKLLQTAENTLPEISLETIEKERVIPDPYTGLPITVKRTQIKPVLVAAEDLPDPTPKPLSAFDNLKFSGALIFYAQGPDKEKFEKFKENFNGVATLGKGLLANIFGSKDTIASKIVPKVDGIYGQNNDGIWTEIEKLGSIDNDGLIRVTFSNKSHELSLTDRNAVEEQMEKTVDFSAKVRISSITLSNSDATDYSTKNDSIVLFQGTLYAFDPDQPQSQIGGPTTPTTLTWGTDNSYHQFDTQFKSELEGGEQISDSKFAPSFFHVYLKPKKSLSRSNDKYKMYIKRSIINAEGQTLSDDFQLKIGFSIKPATVLKGSLI